MRKVVFIFLFLILIFTGCAVKPPIQNLYESLLSQGFEGRFLKGRLYVEGDFSYFLNIPASGCYGDFYLSQNYFLLRITPPFGNEIFLEWDDDKGLRVIVPSRQRVYSPKDEVLKLNGLPYYFLGLKETSRAFHLNSIKGEYFFDREKLEGRINTAIFYFVWRIKELKETSSLPKPIDITGFKEKKLSLPF